MKKHILTFTAMLYISTLAIAQNILLDNSFNSSGKFAHDFGFQDNLTDVKLQSDGKIISVGTALSASFSGKLLVIRQNANGTFDSTFNGTGVVVLEDFNESYAYESFVKSDGSIVIGGTRADGNFQFATLALRLKTDGTRDSTFGTNGIAEIELSTGDDFAYAMTELPNHKILLTGTAIDTGFRNAPVLVRLTEQGSIDSTFGVNGVAAITAIDIDNKLHSIAIQPDGKIVVSGHYGRPLTLSGQFNFDVLVARFTPNGLPDTTFGTNGMVTTKIFNDTVDYVESVYGMQLTGDGSILVAGYTTREDFGFDVLMIKYDSTGTLSSSFGNNGVVMWDKGAQDVATDMELDADGKILLCGTSGGFFFDDRDVLLMRYNMDGTPDSTFDSDGYLITDFTVTPDEANGMALQNDGRIVLAGKTNNGNNNDVAVLRYTFSSPTSIDFLSAPKLMVYPNPARAVEHLQVLFDAQPVKCAAQLYNLLGEIVWEETLSVTDRKASIVLPNEISKGMYLLKVDNASFKLVIE